MLFPALALMTNIITPNPDDGTDDQNGNLKRWWKIWFDSVYQVCLAETQSGITANRPKSSDQNNTMWVGRPYFDTSLGYKIYFKSANPDVWVDYKGTPV